MTLFPGGRSRARQMAKAILLSEKLRWRRENGRTKCQYKCVRWGDKEGQKMMVYRGQKSRKNQCPVSWLMYPIDFRRSLL